MIANEKFIRDIVDGVAECLQGEGYHLEVRKIEKNNAASLTGLCVRKDDEEDALVIYLDGYWKSYTLGMSMEELISDICRLCRISHLEIPFAEGDLVDFSMMKKSIAFKLINRDKNKELLEDVPHRELEDLAVVYYLYLGHDENGQLTALIHNHHMESWGVTEDILYMLAYENTPQIFPMNLQSIEKVLGGFTEEIISGLDDEAKEYLKENKLMYVLTNDTGVFGAAVVLYKDALQQAAEVVGGDFIILPSSCHEVLLIPYDDEIDPEEMRCMVQCINEMEVPPEDVLSDSIYCYRSETGQIEMLAGERTV